MRKRIFSVLLAFAFVMLPVFGASPSKEVSGSSDSEPLTASLFKSVGGKKVQSTLKKLASSGVGKTYKNTYEKVLAEDGFIYGVVVPWFTNNTYGRDIGKSPLRGEGTSGFNPEVVRQLFSNTRTIGFNSVRIWLFETMEGLLIDQYGNPLGLDEEFMSNLTTLLNIARETGVNLDVTFFAHLSFTGNEMGRDVYNRATQMIFDPAKRNDTMQKVIVPLSNLLAQYQDVVMICDVYAEPEGDVYGKFGNTHQQYGTTWKNMSDFIATTANTIRSVIPTMPVTASSGWQNYDNLTRGLFNKMDLDLIGVSIYDDFGDVKPVKDLIVNAPVLLAEFGPATKDNWSDEFQIQNTIAFYENAKAKGYAGAYYWFYGFKESGESLTLIDKSGQLRPVTSAIHFSVMDDKNQRLGLDPDVDKPGLMRGSDPLKIQWFGARQADSYKIERSADKNNWQTIKTVASDDVDNGYFFCTYEDKSVDQGVDYYYRITAFSGSDSSVSDISGPFKMKKVTCAPEDNIVVNNSFEDSDFSVWQAWDPQPQFTVTSEEKYAGSKSAKLEGIGNWNAMVQKVNVKPNTDYTFTLWAKAQPNASGSGSCVSILNAQGNHNQPERHFVYDGLWTMYTFDINSNDNEFMYIYLGDGGGTIYFDEFYMFEKVDN